MRKLLLALMVAGTVALDAPGGYATPPTALGCRLLNVADDTVTGQDVWDGAVAGYVVTDTPGNTVSVRCELRVGTDVRGASSTVTGSGLAMVADRLTYLATETETMVLCTVWTDGSDSGTACSGTITIQVIPQEVLDLFWSGVDTLGGAMGGCFTVVNTGTCNSGVCIVNTGTCDGGFCVVNTDFCGHGCVAVVNLSSCGHRRPPRVDPA